MTKEERQKKLLDRQEELKAHEATLREKGYRYIAGVDEVGRGPLAGPVVTAAVVLPEDFDASGVDDSKKLSEKKREELYDKIIEGCTAFGIGMCDQEIIDEINILQATKKAMSEAIENCAKMLNEVCRSDIDYVIFDAVKLENLGMPQEAVIKGDSKVLAIAAASIVAKVTRDRMMVKYAQDYPWYAFERNKGYGTAAHYAGIEAQGLCPIHRRSFLKKYTGR